MGSTTAVGHEQHEGTNGGHSAPDPTHGREDTGKIVGGARARDVP
jgi:hypothetical protein